MSRWGGPSRVVLAAAAAAMLAAGCSQDKPFDPAHVSTSPHLPPGALLTLAELAPKIDQPINQPLPPLDEVLEESLAIAEQRIAAGEHKAALRLLRQAVPHDLIDPRVQRISGLAKLAAGDRAGALADLSAAADAQPHDLKMQVALGEVAAQLGANDRALKAFRTALLCTTASDTEPLTAHALLGAGRLLKFAGNWTASLQCYDRLERMLETAGRDFAADTRLQDLLLYPQRLYVRQGQLLLLLGRPDKAAVPLERAFRRDRTSQAAARSLMEALSQTGRYDEAIGLLDELAGEPAQFERLPQTAKLLAETMVQAGLAERLIDELARIVAARPSAAAMVSPVAAVVAATDSFDLSRAIAEMGQSTQPDRYGIHYVLAHVALARRQNDLAAEQLRQAVAVKDGFLPAYEALVQLHLSQRQFDQAEVMLEKIKALAPASAFTHAIEGRIHLARGRTNEAIASLSEALRLKPADSETLLLLAEAHAMAGQVRQATRSLFEGLRRHGDDPQLYRRLFDLTVLVGDYQAAHAIAVRLLRRRPDSLPGRIMLAEVYLYLGRMDEAQTLIEQLIEVEPQSAAVQLLALRAELDLARRLPSREQFDQAMRRLDQISQLDPSDMQPLALKARLLMLFEQHGPASELLGDVYRRQPGQSSFARAYVAAMSKAKRYADALAIVDEMLADRPGDRWARTVSLQLLQQLQQPGQAADRADEWAQQATGKDRKSYLLQLVQLSQRSRQFDRACRALDELIAAADNAEQARALKALKTKTLVQAGKYDDAVAHARNWAQADPASVAPIDSLTAALSEADQFELAHAALADWPTDNEQARRRLRPLELALLLEAEQYEAAEQYCRQWAQDEPLDILARAGVLIPLIEARRLDQAELLLADWLAELAQAPTTTAPASRPATQPPAAPATGPASQPTSQPTSQPDTQPAAATAEQLEQIQQILQQMVVRVLALQHRYGEAIQWIEQYLALRPTDIELLNLKSGILDELGRDDDALAAMERAYALAPSDTSLNNNLGYLYADRGVNLARAQQMIRLAISARPNSTAFADSLGWVLYKQGKFGEAGMIFRRLLDRSDEPDEGLGDPVIFDHAGDAFYRLGWTELAERNWSRAVEQAEQADPPGRKARRVLRLATEKVRAVRAGRQPALAPVAGEGEPNEANEQ